MPSPSPSSTSSLSNIPTAHASFEPVRTSETRTLSRPQTNIEVSRIETLRLTHESTVGSKAPQTPRDEWLPMGGGKEFPPSLPDPDRYVVEFTGEGDPMHPHNWPIGTKILLSGILAYVTFTASFASAIFSSTVGAISLHYGISTEVATLGVTLYVLGFAAGPTFWAPASELSGRRWPITAGVFGYSIFTVATATAKDWLARALPASIKLATGTGIGLYLTLIGLTYSAGIGLVTGATDSPIELAGCVDSLRDATTGLCPSDAKMRNPTMWIGIFCGGVLTALLMLYRVKGAVIIGILLVSIISWPRPTPVTYFPHTELGNSMFDFFKQVVTFHPIKHTLVAQDWDITGHGSQFGLAFITFLYVDILDTTGTLYSMARFAGTVDPRTQDFEGSALAYMVDAISVSIGSLFGTSPVTAFVESGAGISEGGKTGLTSCMTGICFFIAVFFAPIFASIPPWATGCTLVIVGALMVKAAAEINWRYLGDAVPAFLTIAIMPFTYSIAYGLIAGILSYITLNGIIWAIEKLTGGRIVPPNKDEKEPWSWRIPGGFFPPWLRRAVRGKKDFWREDERDRSVMDGGSVESQDRPEKQDVAAASKDM
ncbi:hypothetical protein CBS115989_5639 [Aspergillus niger]|nr:hypothetical protein CBS115989_5639 [Aspergillus niger]KAI2861399.1 hypothetical protein CBS11232_1035 [Aspergillus niger]KAI2875247.1 hypothetical protein CBS115988_5565 [Aspergillus niger]